ncbi:MAG TPA: DUF72 domain-containing protein [Devosia sp.]
MFIGTAGWSVDRSLPDFPQEGTALERYASVFSAVEVNSSFYRRHRPATWQRWHDAVPSTFKFSVKLPKTISHEKLLSDVDGEIDNFFSDIVPLGAKLGAVLVQLPPKLVFEAEVAEPFLGALRSRTAVPIFIEPRHVSWAEASSLVGRFDITRVYADPQHEVLRPAQNQNGISYLRLHGSPKIYYSAYPEQDIAQYAGMLDSIASSSWCIFDNTASGAAITDALRMQALVDQAQP